MTDASIHPILIHTPRLERLDLSFTLLYHIQFQQPILTLQKLSLTSTFISASDLVNLVSCLPSLKVLNIGALGVRPGATTSIMNSTAMTLTDDALRQLTDVLLDCPHIESINLVQNAKLGSTKRQDSALAYFVRHVGRKCRVGFYTRLHLLSNLTQKPISGPEPIRNPLLSIRGPLWTTAGYRTGKLSVNNTNLEQNRHRRRRFHLDIKLSGS